jgi:hypothetical protein
VISGPHGGATFGFLYISRVGVALKMVDGRVTNTLDCLCKAPSPSGRGDWKHIRIRI